MLYKKHMEDIENIIKNSIRKKLKSYTPETNKMPFHYRLLGKDRMALFSFIHSLNTTFGISIFEPIAEYIGKINFKVSYKQYNLGNSISEEAQIQIQHIMNRLSSAEKEPNKTKEIEEIRKVANKGRINKIKTVRVDLFLEDNKGNIFLIDIKTAKPNISNFKDFKRTLLEWIAMYLLNNSNRKLHSLIAIPYNPYEPKPY